MTVRYTVFDGEIVEENRNGTIRDYLPDAIGSTVALLDSSQAKTDTFTYWPYGEIKTRTGSTASPFQYVGVLGYYQDSDRLNYVRARYLNNTLARWTSRDPVSYATASHAYSYASNSPATHVDPSGLFPWKELKPSRVNCRHYYDLCKAGWTYACNAWRLCMATGITKEANCVRGCLLCALKERPLGSPGRTCWSIWLDHRACMQACGYSNFCFNSFGYSGFRDAMCYSHWEPTGTQKFLLARCGYDPLPPAIRPTPAIGPVGAPSAFPPPIPEGGPPPYSAGPVRIICTIEPPIDHTVCGHRVRLKL